MKTKLNENDISEIIDLYQTKIPSTHKLAEKYKVGHKKISQILKENNIDINKKGGQSKIGNSSEIESSKTNLYIANDNYELVAKCKKTNTIINDPNNLSGMLTKHIVNLYGDVNIPKNNYQRKKYELINGKKWFEEFFDIIELEIKPTRQCKLCKWNTTDINNKTGCFEQHIQKHHNITIKEYIDKFPEDSHLHIKLLDKLQREVKLKEIDNFVICKLCGEKMMSVTNTHLINKHNISVAEYKLRFPNDKIVSNSISKILSDNAVLTNFNMSPTWASKGETEIREFIESLGFETEKGSNRKLLNGKEIDVMVKGTNILFEYNGLYYHTEKMGKKYNYHLNKTIECNQLGYKLIQIFEDEWITKKELVKTKIKHILKVNDGVKIGGRNVTIKTINKEDKTFFLNNYHIQGSDKSKISYGAYYKDELVGVMTFNSKRNMTKNNDHEYELSRYSTKQNFIISGLASKFLKQFINDYSPKSIISFADRRWTVDPDNNLYVNLGFDLVSIVKPNYFYYNSKINKYKRYHKFSFGKNNIKKKYPNLDFTKSEKELTEELGFDKIWDCGLFKYKLSIDK